MDEKKAGDQCPQPDCDGVLEQVPVAPQHHEHHLTEHLKEAGREASIFLRCSTCLLDVALGG